MTGNFTVNGQPLSLTQSTFIASGGEGEVHAKNGTAYKVYHDASKMLPVGKIQELSVLSQLTNVLGPQAVVYKGNNPSGFSMRFVKGTEFLCKLFTKGFRDKNSISQATINALVKRIQDTATQIHSHHILLVDANEMNFLTSAKFDEVFFIDVDSYQTKSYKATALMESVRDRKVKNNQFTEGSDWFSIGTVMMQLYTGCHPYKGRHPDYSPKDWPVMMDKGISIFNKKCRLPPACSDLSVIPIGHLRWFESVFEKGDRTAPPAPDQAAPVAKVQPKIISSNDKFNLSLVRNYPTNIVAIRYIDGICYAITENATFGDGKEFATFSSVGGYTATRTTKDIVGVQGDLPVLLEHNHIEAKLKAKTFKGNAVIEVESEGFFVANRCVYTVVHESLIEISFINTGVKTNAMQQSVANIFHNHKIFDGLVIQNMLDTCRFALPYEAGKCVVLHVKELDKTRVVDARYECGVAIVLTERNGKYERHTLTFNKDCTQYIDRIEQDATLQDISFAIKDNGVCIAQNDDKFEVFVDNAKVKVVDSSLNGGEKLLAFKNDIFVVNRASLYQIKSK